jgi:hypothetical protein
MSMPSHVVKVPVGPSAPRRGRVPAKQRQHGLIDGRDAERDHLFRLAGELPPDDHWVVIYAPVR